MTYFDLIPICMVLVLLITLSFYDLFVWLYFGFYATITNRIQVSCDYFPRLASFICFLIGLAFGSFLGHLFL